tara:strand:- start:7371 stop:8063 length:693 start_codon:yes stop_codon:yes gene_type:complete
MNLIQDLPQGEQYVLIKLSGGADSSIVYYAVCDKFKDRDDVKIVVVTLDTNFKNQYIASAKRIIRIVRNLTGKAPIDHITRSVRHSETNYVNGQDALVKVAYTRYPITRMYSGLTINPPADQLKKLVDHNIVRCNFDKRLAYEAIATRDISRDMAIKLPKSFDSSGLVFVNHDKKRVAEAYRRYNMMELLYPYTFSCESPPWKLGQNKIPVHCGNCFFCLERWYGFDRII